MSYAETISVIAKPFFEVVEEGFIPVEYQNYDSGFVTFNSNDDIVTLNPPVAGHNRSLHREPGIEIQSEGDRFILRTVIGYAMAARASGSPNIFIVELASLINSLTASAYKVYGDRIIDMTFDRWQTPGLYFWELENNAGYELRLSGKLTPLLEMEDV